MAVQVSYPGVYIEEFAPGAPIQGVGTSTAAFIGPFAAGDLDTPAKMTDWDQFRATFGPAPVPGFFTWYAVRGFFENGGKTCYIVRASNGGYAELMLADRSAAANNVLRVRAVSPGNPATAIQVTVAEAHLLPAATTGLYQPTAALAAVPANRQLSLGNGEGARFRPGDFVTIAAAGERLQVVRISGDTLTLEQNPSGAYVQTDPVRLADAPAGTRTLRIEPAGQLAPGVLVPGTVLTITQGGAVASYTVESVQAEPSPTEPLTYRVTFREGLRTALSLDSANAATVQSEEFDLTVTQGASTSYANLSLDPAHPRFVTGIVNVAGGLVQVELVDPPPPSALPDSFPAAMAATALAGGADEDLTTLADNDYIAALETLERIDDVNLVTVPDRLTDNMQQQLIDHCQRMQDRFAVLNGVAPVPDQPLFGAGSVEAQRAGLDSTRGYAALYYPWLRVPRATGGPPILVPPSGHVCGIIARSDLSRGVHKAPANEVVSGAVGVHRTISSVEQGELNRLGINVIRVFSGGGRPVLFGARTTATDANWNYVNIRRLFLFLEESIEEGIRWAIFEPNNHQLWQKLRRTLTDFLEAQWRAGALFGKTPEDAFYVRIDEGLNPFSEQALGRLNIEIGVRPTYPAEFIIVRIGIWSGGAEVSEG